MFTPAYGELILASARESLPCMVDTVERCEEAGHCVMLTQVACMAFFFFFFFPFLFFFALFLSGEKESDGNADYIKGRRIC